VKGKREEQRIIACDGEPCGSEIEAAVSSSADAEPNPQPKAASVKKSKHGDTKNAAVAHIDNRSFLALLIRSFVSFMLITVISVGLIFLIATWASNRDTLLFRKSVISSYEDLLSRGKFSEIPVSRICGDGGWLCVVSERGEFKYSSDGIPREYTLSELDCIQNYGNEDIITLQSFKMPNGDYNRLISRVPSDKSGSTQYILLDSDLRIISNSIITTKTQFTEKELDLYTYNTRHNGYVIEKFYFAQGDDGFYAICYDTNNEEGVTPYVFLIIFILGVVALLVTMLAVYIRYINKHVQRPLKALGTEMTDFAKNGYRKQLTYHGLKEFEQLADSFNEMVTLLDASEKQRTALEQDRQRMLAGLSHDLKTPITVIQGFSKAMRDGLVSDDEKQKYLNLILSKSESMGMLINGFYEYSKLDHPDFKLNLEDLDIAELTRTYLAVRYDEFGLQGFYLDVDIAEEQLVCSVDKQQLIRVWENLIGNFFKYTPQGSTLYVKLSKRENETLIIFADDGIGISEDLSEDIFAPFVVAEQSRNKQGSGLGLAVCKKIIDAHGGKISLCKSDIENCKTQFEIVLPLKKA